MASAFLASIVQRPLSWFGRIAAAIRATIHYFSNDAKADVQAGLTIAILGIPQAMAFASIAGLPPVTGLYTSTVSCILAALFGSSRHLVTGPSNVTCMLIFSVTAQVAARHAVDPLEVALLLAFLSGLLQLMFGFFKMGSVVKYISNSVVMGFTTGAGILIAANQLRDFFGIRLPRGSASHLFASLSETFGNLNLMNPLSFIIASLTLFLVLFIKRRYPKLPAPLMALLAGTIPVILFGLNHERLGIFRVVVSGDSNMIEGGLVLLHIPELLRHPNWQLLSEIGSGAFSIGMLGLIQSASIARSIAAQSGQRIDFNREFVAQGLANSIGSFFQCFPSAGSFNRSALCYHAGGRTRIAPLLSGIITGVFLVWLGPVTNYVPKAAFAGLLLATAWYMIDRPRFMAIWRTGKNSKLVLAGTLAATLILSLENAVFIGVFLSVATLLHTTGKPDLTQLMQRADGGFEEVPFKKAGKMAVVLINLEGDFYFAAVDDLDYELMQCITDETRVVVLRMKRLRAVGSSAMTMLDHFHELLGKKSITLMVCGIEDELRRILTASGLRDKLGEQNIFYADNRIFQSTELALARARSLVAEEKALINRNLVADGSSPATRHAASKPRHWLQAKDMMNRRFLRFGNDHQLREALWLLTEMIKSHRAGPRPWLFLQDREGRMAEGLSLPQILGELTSHPGFHSHPGASNAEMAAFFKERYIKPINSLVTGTIQCVPGSANVPTILAAVVRNKGRSVPVLDEEGRMTGIIEQRRILMELAKHAPAKGNKVLS